MAPGITIERTFGGKPAYVRIDLHKYGKELSEFFKSKAINLDSEMIDDTRTAPKGYLTHKQFVEQCNTEIDNLCKQYE